MTSIFEQYESNVLMKINSKTEPMALKIPANVAIEILGCPVRVISHCDHIKCEALVPESETPIQYEFKRHGNRYVNSMLGNDIDTMEALVALTRVELNGKL